MASMEGLATLEEVPPRGEVLADEVGVALPDDAALLLALVAGRGGPPLLLILLLPIRSGD